MGTKTISLAEDAYERLKDHKQEGESFTDVVRRLTNADKDPLESAGAYPGLAAEREEFREKLDEDFQERQRDLRQ